MAEGKRLTIDDLRIVRGTSAQAHRDPPGVIVGLEHIAGRAARLGVPNPKATTTAFLMRPDDAQRLGQELLKAAAEAQSPSTH